MVELRRLRLLHELSRLGTVAAVADSLAYSPSSVSVQLAQLEREAGVKLMRRSGRNIELTAAGHRLASYAADALAADESILTELAGADELPRGLLRITAVQSPALALLPGLLERLAHTAPDLEVHVIQRETGPGIEELRSRAVDLVIGLEYDPVPVPRHLDIDRQDFLREDVLVAMHPGHPAAQSQGAVGLSTLEQAAWATGHRGTDIAEVLSNICNRLGDFDPDIHHRSDDGLVLGALAASGRAIALLPALFISVLPQITARRLSDERLQRTLFTATRTSNAQAPATLAVRQALSATAEGVAASSPYLEMLKPKQ